MSEIFGFCGQNDFYPRGSIYPNPKESSLLVSLESLVDVYFPPQKRSRISAPFVFSPIEQKQVSIDLLPDECLFEIFRRLPGGQERSSCACVSKRWLGLLSSIRRDELNYSINNKSKDNASRKSGDVECDGYLSRSLEGKKATDVRLAAIAVGTASRGGLGKLFIRGFNSGSRVSNFGLRAIARGCPSLKILSLWNLSSVGDAGLLEIAKGCTQLEKLDLSRCPAITNNALIAIAKSCPNLSDLTIESCSSIGNDGLQALAQFCPKLKSVSIKSCPFVGDQGIAALLSKTTYSLTKLRLQMLGITDLSLAVIGHYGMSINDLVLTSLSNVSEKGFWVMGNGVGLQKLRSLTVACCQGVTDIGLEAVGKGCPNLKQFSLRKCSFLSDSGLVSFAKAVVSLESLQLEECHRLTQYGFFGSLLSCGAKLKAFSLIDCLGIRDLDAGLPMSSTCSSLRSLSIRNCPGFGDANLVILGKVCPQLQDVELCGLIGITDAGLLPLLEGSQLGIVKLNLSGCLNLTDTAVSTVAAQNCWTLEALNLDGCNKITDASLVSIANNCQLLGNLDVSKCQVTDFGIQALASATKLNLQIFSVAGCSMITDKSLSSLGKMGRTLLGLSLQNCRAISSSTIDCLVEQLWSCDVLH